MLEMFKIYRLAFIILVLLIVINTALAEQAGSIRGMVYDKDFDAPLPNATVTIAETDQKTKTTEEGNYVIGEVKPGTYTLVFSKNGYTRQVKADVVVSPGQMTEVNASLTGDFAEMDEFVVQDVQIGTGTEAALLELRMESPALMDSVSAELISQAGASDAASALKLVSGATIQEGKFAVIRGLPDRFVVSKINGVRLPTADADKRAVELDQFPATVIESIQVSKTFTPDQQGDASGGAVNIILKGIPEEPIITFSAGTSFNTQVHGEDEFLSYEGGGVSTWGKDDGTRDQQESPGPAWWEGPIGISKESAPSNYSWSVAGGGKHEFEDGLKIGGYGSFFYKRDNSFFDNGISDQYWLEDGDDKLIPKYDGDVGDLEETTYTSLYDVTQAKQEVQWGTLGTLGIENENHSLSTAYLFTRTAEDTATLTEDTRGKEALHRYWPDIFGPEYENYDPYDPNHPGNQEGSKKAPYRRNETLKYTERTTTTLQFSGRHKFPGLQFTLTDYFAFLPPEIDWTFATSEATMDEPDKRQFTTQWYPIDETTGLHKPKKPVTGNANIGFITRTWRDITEESNQYLLNLKLPFEQWSGDEGFMKFGIFNDEVDREFNQESFKNFNNPFGSYSYEATWEEYWSSIYDEVYQEEFYTAMEATDIDVDYKGKQEISAWYYMLDVPLTSYFKMIGGTRYEDTELSIKNDAEDDVVWYPNPPTRQKLLPGEADVDFEQQDILPSIGFEFEPYEKITLKGSYSETVARQTFKELTPIEQREYFGADTFIGNPDLEMSALKNYDLRFDYRPYEGGLASISYFYKDITDPIEYVQVPTAYIDFTTPKNYPEGTLDGFELETRHKLGYFWEELEGISVGANATFIDSEVSITEEEKVNLGRIGRLFHKRDMTNAPEYLYNLYMTYDIQDIGTKLGLFYTVRGDTLVAGAGVDDARFIPNVYEKEYGTLNFTLSQKFGENWNLKFKAKNLLNPEVEEIYRSRFNDDVTKSSYTKGREFSISFSGKF